MSQGISEFSFLAADAAVVGRSAPLPPVERVWLNAQVSALRWGEGAATIVLLHGVALNAHTWDATLLAWPQSASFLALDLPGHGDSPWRADGRYSPSVLAETPPAALAAAGERGWLEATPTIVGHSLGGLTAIEMIRTSAMALRRLVLVDILPLPAGAARTVAEFLNGPAWFASREAIVERALAFGLGGERAAVERGVFLNTRLDADGRVIWKHHFGQLGGSALHLPDPEQVWPIIQHSSVPIDLVAASQSFIDAALAERFARSRPGGRLRRVAGGHNLQEDNPIQLAATLAELVGPRGVEPAAAGA